MFSLKFPLILLLVPLTEIQTLPDNNRGFFKESRLLLARLKAAVERVQNMTTVENCFDPDAMGERIGRPC
jgi:hypothetical protein